MQRDLSLRVVVPVFIVVFGLAFGSGWYSRDRGIPRFPGEHASDVEGVIESLALAGVVCSQELERDQSSGGRSTIVWCRAEPTFTLIVYGSVLESYVSLDRARWAACLRADGSTTSHQWYMARQGTWNMLTFDRNTASAAGRLNGVTITIGACPLPVVGWLA